MSEIETQKAAVEDAKAQQQYYQVHQQATQQKVGNLHAVPPDRTPVQSVSLQLHNTRSGAAWTSQCIAMSLAVLLLQGTACATTQYMFWCSLNITMHCYVTGCFAASTHSKLIRHDSVVSAWL